MHVDRVDQRNTKAELFTRIGKLNVLLEASTSQPCHLVTRIVQRADN